jgi:hypothetical protein
MSEFEPKKAEHSIRRFVGPASCICAEGGCPCEIEEFVSHMILFVRPPPDLQCVYLMPLGEGYFCASPMREEIYERYGSSADSSHRGQIGHQAPAG